MSAIMILLRRAVKGRACLVCVRVFAVFIACNNFNALRNKQIIFDWVKTGARKGKTQMYNEFKLSDKWKNPFL